MQALRSVDLIERGEELKRMQRHKLCNVTSSQNMRCKEIEHLILKYGNDVDVRWHANLESISPNGLIR